MKKTGKNSYCLFIKKHINYILNKYKKINDKLSIYILFLIKQYTLLNKENNDFIEVEIQIKKHLTKSKIKNITNIYKKTLKKLISELKNSEENEDLYLEIFELIEIMYYFPEYFNKDIYKFAYIDLRKYKELKEYIKEKPELTIKLYNEIFNDNFQNILKKYFNKKSTPIIFSSNNIENLIYKFFDKKITKKEKKLLNEYLKNNFEDYKNFHKLNELLNLNIIDKTYLNLNKRFKKLKNKIFNEELFVFNLSNYNKFIPLAADSENEEIDEIIEIYNKSGIKINGFLKNNNLKITFNLKPDKLIINQKVKKIKNNEFNIDLLNNKKINLEIQIKKNIIKKEFFLYE